MATAFDLTLGYPQWQGSGRGEKLLRGAAATAAVCARFAPLVSIAPSEKTGDAHDIRRWEAIDQNFRAAQAMLEEYRPARLLTAGGDCAVDIAPIDYLHRLYPDLSVIWIDAHPDANTPVTSPSGNFHGMPVSAVMGQAPEPMRRHLGAPIDPARFRYHGIRAADEGDRAFQREHGLMLFDPQMPMTGPVHIHFDLDALDPNEFPYLAYPEPGGLVVGDAIALVRGIAARGDLVGLTITEFAPADDREAQAGSDVIAALCEAAVG